jgi:hypothetical protein
MTVHLFVMAPTAQPLSLSPALGSGSPVADAGWLRWRRSSDACATGVWVRRTWLARTPDRGSVKQ